MDGGIHIVSAIVVITNIFVFLIVILLLLCCGLWIVDHFHGGGPTEKSQLGKGQSIYCVSFLNNNNNDPPHFHLPGLLHKIVSSMYCNE